MRDRPASVILRLLAGTAAGQTAALGSLILLGGLMPVAMTLATGVLVGSVPGAVDGGLGSLAGRRLLAALGVVAASYTLEQVIAPVRDALAFSLNSRLTLAQREAVMRATLGPAGIAHLEDPSVADEIALTDGAPGLRGWAQGRLVQSLAQSWTAKVRGAGSAVILAGFQWWAPIVLFAGWSSTYRWIDNEIRTLFKGMDLETPTLRRSGYYRTLAATPPAAKEIRVFGLGSWAIERFQRDWLDGMTTVWRERKGHRWLMLQTIGIITVANAMVFVLLARAGVRGDISLGALAVFAQAALGVMELASQGDSGFIVREGGVLLRRSVELREKTRTAISDLSGSARADGMPAQGIRFEGVRFRYPTAHRDVFEELDLWIPAGRSLAIVGENGAGKTTLIKLLARLYDPSGGAITVDGTDLRELDPASWRERLAVIFQDFVRYELSARDNVGLGRLELLGDDGALGSAARAASAASVVETLPARWDTVLSRAYAGGADLSGGEWQRIALARALLSTQGGASVLVLDEPTANLDVRAEAELFDRFLELTRGMTTILISHRFSSVRHADEICVLEDGKVVERGPHDVLMAADGRYTRMFNLQASRFRESLRGAVGGQSPPTVADA